MAQEKKTGLPENAFISGRIGPEKEPIVRRSRAAVKLRPRIRASIWSVTVSAAEMIAF
jgi:hypothetical protein